MIPIYWCGRPVTAADECEALATVAERLGGPHVLVNAASVAHGTGIAEITPGGVGPRARRQSAWERQSAWDVLRLPVRAPLDACCSSSVSKTDDFERPAARSALVT
jgi:NAD(P)-dependent dehydrogenase (short-subunit alcohol dehydrogenase family)